MNISGWESVSEFLQAVGPVPRLQILFAIGRKEPCVCHLEATFGWRQAYLSQHLKALREAGVVAASRKGRNIHYRLADPRLLDFIRRSAELRGVALPGISPRRKCSCPDCRCERKCA
jgi:DNA-binding transcriptional ArsR family regulator